MSQFHSEAVGSPVIIFFPLYAMTSTLVKHAIGLDVSKSDVAACLVSLDDQQQTKIKATHRFMNSPKGFAELDQWVKHHRREIALPLVYVLEATGVYFESLAWHLHGQAAYVSVLLPWRAKHYFQSLGFESKTDPIDAKALAQMGAYQALPRWQPLSVTIEPLRERTRQYQSLQEQRTQIQNQRHAQQHSHLPDKLVIKQLNQMLSLIDKQLDELAKAIKTLLEADPALVWCSPKTGQQG